MRALALDQVGHVQAPVLGHQRLELGALILCISRDTHAQSEESLGYVADFLHRQELAGLGAVTKPCKGDHGLEQLHREIVFRRVGGLRDAVVERARRGEVRISEGRAKLVDKRLDLALRWKGMNWRWGQGCFEGVERRET